ncbi:TPA: restriction endonuclease subunit S [Vibrio vulnificus]
MAYDVVPLKELCNDFKKDIVDGPFGSNLKRKHFTDSGVAVLKIQNIKPFLINDKKMEFVTPEKFQELKRHSFQKGDIVMTKLGSPLGVSAIVEDLEEGVIVADLVRIRAEKINTKYLCYHLNSPVTSAYINSFQKGATRPRVKISVARELPILTPPSDVQKQIVMKLDAAFSDIEKAKKYAEHNIKNARDLFGSYLYQVFNEKDDHWVETTLGSIAEVSSGGTPKKSQKSFWGGDLPWYSSGELNELYTVNPKAMITEEGLAGSNAKIFPKGSLLIGMYDTAALKMSILDRDGAFNQAIAGVKPTNGVNLEFVLHWINLIKPQLLAQRRGVRQKNLNQSKIKDIPLFLPAIDKQNDVVKKIRDFEGLCVGLISIYEKKIEELNDLKQSISQKAFMGKL